MHDTCVSHVCHLYVVTCTFVACHMCVTYVSHVTCRHQKRVCTACYRIIEVFLQGDSRKNELYVSRFVPFFEGQVRHLLPLCSGRDALLLLPQSSRDSHATIFAPPLLQIRLGLNAEDMLIELVRDNPCVCMGWGRVIAIPHYEGRVEVLNTSCMAPMSNHDLT